MNQRTCLECNEPLKGRADQKFCDDQCRSTYNNRKFSDSYNLIRKLNRILKKNHNILSQLNPGGKITIAKNELIHKGFDFTYHTHMYITRDNRTYYFCYDQGYLELENKKYLLVKKKNE
jgi:hypothetical protein